MDFSLTPEHEMVVRMVRDFAEKEVAPYVKEYDRAHKPFVRAIERMAELGILGICIPVRYGGQGMDYISLGLACEELERVDTFLRVVMSVHVGLNSLGLLQWGTEEQKRRFLVPQARGERWAAPGPTDPGTGPAAAAPAPPAPPWWSPSPGPTRPSPRWPPPPDGRETSTSSTARRCGSAWPLWPTTSWSSPAPTPRPPPPRRSPPAPWRGG